MLPDGLAYIFVFLIKTRVIFAHDTLQIGKRLHHVRAQVGLTKHGGAPSHLAIGTNFIRYP